MRKKKKQKNRYIKLLKAQFIKQDIYKYLFWGLLSVTLIGIILPKLFYLIGICCVLGWGYYNSSRLIPK